jgi:hypothetical protein
MKGRRVVAGSVPINNIVDLRQEFEAANTVDSLPSLTSRLGMLDEKATQLYG